jgi:dipeptidyl aminopeptidase/acylaminoacyl peptidase
MTDERVEAARSQWAPRFLAHGVDYNDFVRITGRIETWSDWLDAWAEAGQQLEDLASAAQRDGHRRTAGEFYVRAAVYYHFAKSLWLEDVHKHRQLTVRSVTALQQGMRNLDPTFERVEVPFGRDRVVANVRRPAGVERPPLVILLPGMDSVKEEFPAWEDTFLHRGLATASLDGPGQGEAGFVNPLQPDFEVPVGAFIDAIAGRSDIDTERIGITGLGMGGYYASRAAAFEPRIQAAGVVGGPYQFERMPALVRAKFMFSAQISDEASAARFASTFTLDGVVQQIRQPYMVVHGQHDAVMPWQDAEQRAKQAPRGEFRLYPDGNTVCQSVTHRLRPFLADWLKAKLTSF